MTKRTPNM